MTKVSVRISLNKDPYINYDIIFKAEVEHLVILSQFIFFPYSSKCLSWFGFCILVYFTAQSTVLERLLWHLNHFHIIVSVQNTKESLKWIFRPSPLTMLWFIWIGFIAQCLASFQIKLNQSQPNIPFQPPKATQSQDRTRASLIDLLSLSKLVLSTVSIFLVFHTSC